MAKEKDKFLDVFRDVWGNVTTACQQFGIDRTTFYLWCNTDADFKAKADAVKEIRKDFIESALDKKIKEGDTTAIIFAAKTQCKDRGYIEKTESNVKLDVEQPLFGKE